MLPAFASVSCRSKRLSFHIQFQLLSYFHIYYLHTACTQTSLFLLLLVCALSFVFRLHCFRVIFAKLCKLTRRLVGVRSSSSSSFIRKTQDAMHNLQALGRGVAPQEQRRNCHSKPGGMKMPA